MAKRLRDGDGDRRNYVDKERPDHISPEDFCAFYDKFRIEKGYTAHLENMRCPFAKFWPDRYSAFVNSCHGLGFPTHQKLNEHITRQHSPDLAKEKERTAPLPDKNKYDAWKNSTKKREGIKMDKNDKRKKWWKTAEALGLTTKPRELPENVHMVSAADQIPLINPFVEWWSGRDQPTTKVDPSTQTDFSETAAYRDPTTTAQRLNERPLADDVLFQEPARDSGYGSMGPQETLDKDEPPCSDGELQSRTQYAEDEKDYFLENTHLSEANTFGFLTGGGSLDAIPEDGGDFDLFEDVNWD